MVYIDGIPIRDSIHTDFSTISGDWVEYRKILTGQFYSGDSTGRYSEFTQDIQEFNRKIDTLSGQFSDTGLFIDPYDNGFRYTGDGNFRKWP